VQEEVTAAKMMFLAKKRDSVPKDIGMDLLILKDKRSYEEPYDRSLEAGVNVVVAQSSQEPTELDKAGIFRIALDRSEGLIIAAHYGVNDMSKPLNIVKGKTAQMVYLKVLELKLLSNLDHAVYLGAELAKAEIALDTGKEYVQDAEMFKKRILTF
jgi:dihydropteroate synthase-like protein